VIGRGSHRTRMQPEKVSTSSSTKITCSRNLTLDRNGQAAVVPCTFIGQGPPRERCDLGLHLSQSLVGVCHKKTMTLAHKIRQTLESANYSPCSWATNSFWKGDLSGTSLHWLQPHR